MFRSYRRYALGMPKFDLGSSKADRHSLPMSLAVFLTKEMLALGEILPCLDAQGTSTMIRNNLDCIRYRTCTFFTEHMPSVEVSCLA